MDRFVIRKKIVKRSETDADEPQPSTSYQNQNSSDESEHETNETAQEASTNVDTDWRPIPKRKMSEVKYRENWKTEYKWLTKKSENAYCTFCNKSLAGGKKHLQRHSESEIHKKNERKLYGTVNMPTTLTQMPKNIFNKDLKKTELKLVMFAVEHNLPFVIFEHLPKFFCSLPDKSILNSVMCSRTKATNLVNDKISPFAQALLANILKNIEIT